MSELIEFGEVEAKGRKNDSDVTQFGCPEILVDFQIRHNSSWYVSLEALKNNIDRNGTKEKQRAR